MRRVAIGLLITLLVAGVLIALSFAHPRTRAWWFVVEDKVVWRNPRVTRGLEAALADCALQEWSSPLPLAAMIVQDKADPCPGDRLPALLRAHLTPANERLLFAYLERHRVSETATKRFVRAELVPKAPVPELAWNLLEAPETSPRLRYEIASDVLASDASDRAIALERLPRIHGIGTLVLFESFADDPSLFPMGIDFLEAPPPVRPLPGDPDGVAFRSWIVDRAGRGLGLDREDLAREVERVHRGLLPRTVPTALYGTLRNAPQGTCEAVDDPCLRLMARLLRIVRDDGDEPTPELWPELGDGALTAWIVDSAAAWVARAPTADERAARILAVVVHPEHDGVGHDPIAALTWGAGTPGATAALVGELARRADVAVQLEVSTDGALQIAFRSATATVPTIGAAERAGPLAQPADLARAEALTTALELGDLVRAQDIAASFEDPIVPWVASLVGELKARTAPPPSKKKTRKRR